MLEYVSWILYMLIKTCRSHWLCIQTPGQQGCGVWKQFNNFLYSFTGKNVFRAKGPPRWTQQNCYISTWIFSNQIQLELFKLNFKLLTLSLSHRDLAIYFKLHSSKWFFFTSCTHWNYRIQIQKFRSDHHDWFSAKK